MMKTIHVPRIDARYWTAITMASIFGTNMGDYYAHESGLGLIGGMPILMALAALAFILERFDRMSHQIYYWLVIILIRTAATNIADYLAFRAHLNAIGLSIGLALLLGFLAVRRTLRSGVDSPGARGGRLGLPVTDARYWTGMLTAGVLGTVLGDVCAHAVGVGTAALMLGAVLAVALSLGGRGLLQTAQYYWLTIAVARTAGTAIGDWFAEGDTLHLGLNASTLLTGIAFVSVLVLWRTSAVQSSEPTIAA
jgi:uncharacterized membrane-anchored protein